MITERRLFSITMGDINTLVSAVLDTPRTEEVVMLFNDLVIPVYPEDDRNDVLERWREKRTASLQ